MRSSIKLKSYFFTFLGRSEDPDDNDNRIFVVHDKLLPNPGNRDSIVKRLLGYCMQENPGYADFRLVTVLQKIDFTDVDDVIKEGDVFFGFNRAIYQGGRWIEG